MSTEDKAKHTGQDIKGKVKEGVGALTGNDDLRAEGQGDQAEAEAKRKVDQAKDTAKHAAQDAKGKVKEGVGTVTGNDRMKAEGQGDQAAAEVKEDFNR